MCYGMSFHSDLKSDALLDVQSRFDHQVVSGEVAPGHLTVAGESGASMHHSEIVDEDDRAGQQLNLDCHLWIVTNSREGLIRLIEFYDVLWLRQSLPSIERETKRSAIVWIEAYLGIASIGSQLDHRPRRRPREQWKCCRVAWHFGPSSRVDCEPSVPPPSHRTILQKRKRVRSSTSSPCTRPRPSLRNLAMSIDSRAPESMVTCPRNGSVASSSGPGSTRTSPRFPNL
ncbi:hypothetical protein PENTCL1PPCAC_7210 [Pristionchus entomophagus]|uniref:Uncharacterized protein n=1 Tax=Pristionchus entomophagus TaxID=358040 RepID=A0AAV5SY64_9BILA|nr:hypothetical protein PENTCL1PPCAC_7210 [Pristionchus entomophagus]